MNQNMEKITPDQGQDVSCQWVLDHLDSISLIDVRNPDEYNGPLGHINNARLIPIAEFDFRQSEIPSEGPVVYICHSGKRSLMAVEKMRNRGQEDSWNMAGGMVKWSGSGFPAQR